MVIPDLRQPQEGKVEAPLNPSLQLAQPTRARMERTP